MPYGIRTPGQINTPVGPAPGIIQHANRLQDTDVTYPNQVGAGANDVWDHVTLRAADLPTMVRGPIAVTKLVLLERDGVAVYITFGRDAATQDGAYDLLHPGLGLLEMPIPPTTEIGIMYDPAGDADGNPPTRPLELYMLAGASAVR